MSSRDCLPAFGGTRDPEKDPLHFGAVLGFSGSPLSAILSSQEAWEKVFGPFPFRETGLGIITNKMNHMQTTNVELMRMARESLKGKWELSVGVTGVYFLTIISLQSIKDIGPVMSVFIDGPLMGGLVIFFLAMARGDDAKFEQLFDGFKRYLKYFGAYMLILVYVLLWSLLLIVPGIIAAFSYAMTYYIIADHPSIDAADALKKSKEMMDGNKGKYFGLMLRFLGWSLLAILSLGIGFLWLIPYMQVATAKFYDDLKTNPSGKDPSSIPEAETGNVPKDAETEPARDADADGPAPEAKPDEEKK